MSKEKPIIIKAPAGINVQGSSSGLFKSSNGNQSTKGTSSSSNKFSKGKK